MLGLRNEAGDIAMADEYDYAKRADDIADASRRFVIGLNTGGIAIALIFATSMSEQGVHPRWIVLPVLLMSLGLCTSGFGLWYAKHESLKRRDAAAAGEPIPPFGRWHRRNATYEAVATVFFITAVLVGLWRLSALNFPDDESSEALRARYFQHGPSVPPGIQYGPYAPY